jgi:hypothetical protein
MENSNDIKLIIEKRSQDLYFELRAGLQGITAKLMSENDRLRAALERISTISDYSSDVGHAENMARAALEGQKVTYGKLD